MQKVSELRFQDRYLGTTINEPLIYILFKDACEICIILFLPLSNGSRYTDMSVGMIPVEGIEMEARKKSKNPLEGYFW